MKTLNPGAAGRRILGIDIGVRAMPPLAQRRRLEAERRCCGPEFFSGDIEHGNLPEEKSLSRLRDKIGA